MLTITSQDNKTINSNNYAIEAIDCGNNKYMLVAYGITEQTLNETIIMARFSSDEQTFDTLKSIAALGRYKEDITYCIPKDVHKYGTFRERMNRLSKEI